MQPCGRFLWFFLGRGIICLLFSRKWGNIKVPKCRCWMYQYLYTHIHTHSWIYRQLHASMCVSITVFELYWYDKYFLSVKFAPCLALKHYWLRIRFLTNPSVRTTLSCITSLKDFLMTKHESDFLKIVFI